MLKTSGNGEPRVLPLSVRYQVPIIFTKASGGSSAREQFRKDIRGFRDEVSRAVVRAWRCLGAKGESPSEQFISKYYLEDVPAQQPVDEFKFKQGFPAQVCIVNSGSEVWGD